MQLNVTIRGEEVPVGSNIDEFSLSDAETMEKITGSDLANINMRSVTASIGFIFISGRKVFPDLKLAEVRALPIGAMRMVADAADSETPAVPLADELVAADPTQPAPSDGPLPSP